MKSDWKAGHGPDWVVSAWCQFSSAPLTTRSSAICGVPPCPGVLILSDLTLSVPGVTEVSVRLVSIVQSPPPLEVLVLSSSRVHE